MNFKELNPKALEFMRTSISQTELFSELDMVDKITIFNLIIDGISLYLEGVQNEAISSNGNSNLH